MIEPEQFHKQLEVLESRVQIMITEVKRLKKEKVGLEVRLSQRDKEWDQVQEERNGVRLRIENILGTLNHLEEELGS